MAGCQKGKNTIIAGQVIAITTDNRKHLYLWNHDIQDQNSKGKSGVLDHDELEETVPWRLRSQSTTDMVT